MGLQEVPKLFELRSVPFSGTIYQHRSSHSSLGATTAAAAAHSSNCRRRHHHPDHHHGNHFNVVGKVLWAL